MAKLFDFECSTHGLFEAWDNAGEIHQCPRCGRNCKRVIGCKGILLKFNADFPRADRMWADWHETETRRQSADPEFYD